MFRKVTKGFQAYRCLSCEQKLLLNKRTGLRCVYCTAHSVDYTLVPITLRTIVEEEIVC